MSQVIVKSLADSWYAIQLIKNDKDHYVLYLNEVTGTDLVCEIKIPLVYTQVASIKLLFDNAL